MNTHHIIAGCLTAATLLLSTPQAHADAEGCGLYLTFLAPHETQLDHPSGDPIIFRVDDSRCRFEHIIDDPEFSATLSDENNILIEGELQSLGDKLISFTPNTPLLPETQYTFTVSHDTPHIGNVPQSISWTTTPAQTPRPLPDDIEVDVVEMITRPFQYTQGRFGVAYNGKLALEPPNDTVAAYKIYGDHYRTKQAFPISNDGTYLALGSMNGESLEVEEAEALAYNDVCLTIETVLRDATEGPTVELCVTPEVTPTEYDPNAPPQPQEEEEEEGGEEEGDDEDNQAEEEQNNEDIGMGAEDTQDEDTAGCSVSNGHRGPSEGHTALWALLALGALVVRRRSGR